MTSYLSLDDYLAAWAKGDTLRQPVAATVAALADASKDIADLIAAGPLEGQLSKLRNDKSGGDFQTELDIRRQRSSDRGLVARAGRRRRLRGTRRAGEH